MVNNLQYQGLYGHFTDTDYAQKTEEIVLDSLSRVQEACKGGLNLQDLFYSLIDDLGCQRQEIAISSQTNQCYRFGKKRRDTSDTTHYTCLGPRTNTIETTYRRITTYLVRDDYKPYGAQLLNYFAEQVTSKDLPSPFKTSANSAPSKIEKSIKIETRTPEKRCQFQLFLCDKKRISDLHWDAKNHPDQEKFPQDEVIQRFRVKVWKREISPETLDLDYPLSREDTMRIKTAEAWRSLRLHTRKAYPATFRWDTMSPVFQVLPTFYPSLQESPILGNKKNQKDIYLLGQARIEIDGKMTLLSEYISWIWRDDHLDTHLSERIQDGSVFVIHPDWVRADTILQEIARIFERALQWDASKDDLNALKREMGLFCYLFAHATPYVRGSAATIKWLEEVVYRYHNFKIIRAMTEINGQMKEVCVDLEALAAPLFSTFMEKYPSTFTISRLPC